MRFETWLNTDLSKPIQVRILPGTMYSGDVEANLIGVNVYQAGEPAEIEDSIFGYVIREDGYTVPIDGESDGNQAWIILPASAYTVNGLLSIVIKAGNTTIGACSTAIYRTTTEAVVDPGTVVPSLSELLAAVAACEQATEQAQAVVSSSVRYDQAQSLTDPQKQTARTNIDAIKLTVNGTTMVFE